MRERRKRPGTDQVPGLMPLGSLKYLAKDFLISKLAVQGLCHFNWAEPHTDRHSEQDVVCSHMMTNLENL